MVRSRDFTEEFHKLQPIRMKHLYYFKIKTRFFDTTKIDINDETIFETKIVIPRSSVAQRFS